MDIAAPIVDPVDMKHNVENNLFDEVVEEAHDGLCDLPSRSDLSLRTLILMQRLEIGQQLVRCDLRKKWSLFLSH